MNDFSHSTAAVLEPDSKGSAPVRDSSAARPRERTSRPLRLGFLGLGWIGRKRMEALIDVPEVQIAALADPDGECLQQAEQSAAAHRPKILTHFDELLRCDLDGMVIATPSALHAPQAIAALERGLAVFCQKPLAITAMDTSRVVNAAHRANRLLDVDFCYRHVQGMSALRERVRNGSLGELRALDLTFHNAYAPSKNWCFDRRLAGGGCLADLGVHLADLLLWLLDFPDAAVSRSHLFSRGRRLAAQDMAIEDLALAELMLENGAVARLSCSWNFHAGCDAIIEVALHGTEGGAAWRNVDGSFYDFEIHAFRGAERELLGGYPDEWGGRALRHWVDRLHQNRGFDSEAFGLVKVARLIDACYER